MSLYTTVADSSANSYCTIAEITSNLFGASKSLWEGLSTEDQENYAIYATKLIDRLHYRGLKFSFDSSIVNNTEHYTCTQALKFPLEETYYYTDTSSTTKIPYIPDAIKQAQCAQIGAMLSGFSPTSYLEYRTQGISSVGLGSGVSITFSNNNTKKISKEDFLCPEARVLLQPFLASKDKVLRIDRG